MTLTAAALLVCALASPATLKETVAAVVLPPAVGKSARIDRSWPAVVVAGDLVTFARTSAADAEMTVVGSAAQGGASDRIGPLHEALGALRRTPNVPGVVVVYADAAAPFSTMRAVLSTIELAGYVEVVVAVATKGGPRALRPHPRALATGGKRCDQAAVADDATPWSKVVADAARADVAACKARDEAARDAASAMLRGMTAQPAAPASSSGLPREGIVRVLEAAAPALRACHDEAKQRGAAIAGKVVVRLAIGAGGRVLSSSIDGDGLRDPAARLCVAGVIDQLVFAAPQDGAVAQVTFPFELAR